MVNLRLFCGLDVHIARQYFIRFIFRIVLCLDSNIIFIGNAGVRIIVMIIYYNSRQC